MGLLFFENVVFMIAHCLLFSLIVVFLCYCNTLFFMGMPFLICSYFFSIFKKFFHNPLMICKARNRSNDATESQMEKRPALMLIF